MTEKATRVRSAPAGTGEGEVDGALGDGVLGLFGARAARAPQPSKKGAQSRASTSARDISVR